METLLRLLRSLGHAGATRNAYEAIEAQRLQLLAADRLAGRCPAPVERPAASA